MLNGTCTMFLRYPCTPCTLHCQHANPHSWSGVFNLLKFYLTPKKKKKDQNGYYLPSWLLVNCYCCLHCTDSACKFPVIHSGSKVVANISGIFRGNISRICQKFLPDIKFQEKFPNLFAAMLNCTHATIQYSIVL